MLITLLVCIPGAFSGLPSENPAPLPGPFHLLFLQYRLTARDLLARNCIFVPSCSVYGEEAIAEYGPVLGVMMALQRWTRCHASARYQDIYTPVGQHLHDPLHVDEGTALWDSYLLPF